MDRTAEYLAPSSIGHALIGIDTRGLIRLWNDAAEDLYGWPASSALGRPVTELTGPPVSPSVWARITGVLSGESVCEQYLVRHRDGHEFTVLAALRPWREATGEIVGVVGVTVDVSEWHRLARLSEAANVPGVGTWEIDEANQVVSVDASMAAMLGLEPAPTRLPLRTWPTFIHPNDRARLDRAGEQVRQGAATSGVGFRIVRSDGDTIHVISRGAALDDSIGAPNRRGGIILDVTDSLRDSQRLVDTLESFRDGYFTLDTSFRFCFVNRSAEQWMGIPRDEVLGRVPWEVFGDAASSFERNYRRAAEHREIVDFEEYFAPHDAWYRVRAVPTASGLSVTFYDATEEHRRDAEREHALTHDTLTGLGNRNAIERWLSAALDEPDPRVAVFLMDLDRFKYINDGFGHGAGDELLRRIGDRIRTLADRHDHPVLVARVGGDEFAIAAGFGNEDDARQILRDLLATVREPVEFGDWNFVVTASIGVTRSDTEREHSPEILLREAATALHRAQEAGGDRIVSFNQALHDRVLRLVTIESGLRRALDRHELRVVYQPSFDLRTGLATGAEALVRWHDPERGVVSPGEFIPVAEETGLVVAVGERVLDLVAKHIQGRPQPPGEPPFTVWVNVSVQQLSEALVTRIHSEPAFHDGRLGLEVTETGLLERPECAASALAELSDAGVRIAIDDFGTGFSSLQRLLQYPFDLLKIDQSFVRRIDDADHRAVVAASIYLGHGLQKRIVAEGVETRGQLLTLMKLGCDEVSGFYLAPPTPPSQLIDAIRAGVQTLAEDRPHQAS